MNIILRSAAALFALSTFALAGCSADTGEDTESAASAEGNEIGASVDELTNTGPTYQAGTKLVTIANLNLRSGPSVDDQVKQTMPNGSEVTVRETSGDNGWIAISFNGYSGWGHTSYLIEADGSDNGGGGSADTSGEYNASRGNKLAQTAIRVNGRPSGGKCALELSNSVERSNIVPAGRWRRNHAWALCNAMKNDSSYQRSVGFKVKSMTTREAPKGSIIGWRPGQCGYNRTYGHIEAISNDNNLACSDFCGRVKTCTAGAIFIPTAL